MRFSLPVVALFAATIVPVGTVHAAEAETVSIKVGETTAEVTIGGEHFATYNFGSDLPKPFFNPVKAPGGAIITRALKDPEDHPHHKGVWVAIDEVNEIKFWAEKGTIRNRSVRAITPQGNPARMEVVNEWLGEDGQPLVIERTIITIHANRLMEWQITFTAGDEPVTFADTKEGLFGIRLPNGMREKENGSIVNSDGEQGSKATWGRHAAWIDYYGPVDGKTVGVALFDDPRNFRRSRYHVRNYGLFTISPFGEKAYTGGKQEAKPKMLKPGESFSLRYGLFVHAGDTKQGGVTSAYQAFTKNRD